MIRRLTFADATIAIPHLSGRRGRRSFATESQNPLDLTYACEVLIHAGEPEAGFLLFVWCAGGDGFAERLRLGFEFHAADRDARIA
jgi:hypothetical protein